MLSLQGLRENKGLSKTALAKLVGENSGYITMVEQHKKPLSVSAAMKIADVFGIDGAKLHYETLLRCSSIRWQGEYTDVFPNGVGVDDLMKAVEKIIRKKHEYMMVEYQELKKFEEIKVKYEVEIAGVKTQKTNFFDKGKQQKKKA